jgi:hypothetical protein
MTDTIDPTVRPMNGSIRTVSVKPNLNLNPNGQPFGLSMALSDDIINQILYQTFRSGMLSLDADNIFDACEPLIYLLLPQICDAFQQGSEAIPLDVKIRPQLPPVIMMNQSKAGTIETEVQIGDLFIYVYADTLEGQEVVMTLSVGVKLPTIFSHDYEDNTLGVDFGEAYVIVDTIDNPLTIPEGLFEGLAPLLVQLILPILSEALDSFELPDFNISGENYYVQINDIFVLGSSQDFLGVFADIMMEVPPK